MSKKINVTRDMESRARIAAQSHAQMPIAAVPPAVEIVTSNQPNDAQSEETVRPAADQSPLAAEKPKKAGRTPKRNPETV